MVSSRRVEDVDRALVLYCAEWPLQKPMPGSQSVKTECNKVREEGKQAVVRDAIFDKQ